MSFESLALHPSIKEAIAASGYTTPTPVQAKAIPFILDGRDVVACAQTGTGKTAAFVLPALNSLVDAPRSKHPRILILTPTRELAVQITKSVDQYGRKMRFNKASLVGGMPYHAQIRDLQRGAEIIIATPGRLIDHLENGRVDLSHIDMLILDECDRMLDMGFIDDVRHIASKTPQDRQTLLFSATLDPALNRIVQELLKEPECFDLSQAQLTAPKIKQTLYKTKHMHDKMRLLKQLLGTGMFKAIIFVATKISADNVADELCDAGFAAAALHGGLRQNVRSRVLDSFGRGKVQFLVATDVAARGIDIHDITHVINVDLPRQSEDYVHRIGRTGRAGRDGEAISFVSNMDIQHVQRIERYLGQRLRLVQLLEGTTEVQEISPERPFVKNDDTRLEKSGYGYGKKRENERQQRSSGSRFERSNHRGGSSDRPAFKKRDDSSRGAGRSYSRDDSSRGAGRSYSRDEQPRRGEFRSMEAKPFHRHSDSKSVERRSDDPRVSYRSDDKNRGNAGVKSSFRHNENRGRGQDMNPFAKPEKRSYINDDRDSKPRSYAAPRRGEKSTGGFSPVKKASFRSKAANESKPFQRRERKEVNA